MLRCAAAVVLMSAIACSKDTVGPGSSGSLALSSATAAFDAMVSGANPGTANIAITNGASGTLSGLRTGVAYTPGQATGWLAAGLSATTAPSTLTLTATTGALAAGTYTAIVAVTGDGAVNGPQTIAVTFVLFANGIYVSESDPQALDAATCGLGPAGSGAGRFPCLTIAHGLVRASAIGRTAVLVADGLYDEAVTLVDGISLLGGHRPDTWDRHVVTTNTIIQGAALLGIHRAAVSASGITSPTTFEGFVVRGPLNDTAGGNSYGIYVSSSTANLAIRHNVILAGRGGPGTAGAAASPVGAAAPGGDRGDNPTGYDAFTATGTGACNVSNNRLLLNGGSKTFGGDDVSGGRGGGTSCPTSTTRTQLSAGNGLAGQPGVGIGGGTNGSNGIGGSEGTDSFSVSLGELCFVPNSPASMDGGNGTAGGRGGDGSAAAGGVTDTGLVSLSHWIGAPGASGVSGSNGGGGGGGGAGGGGYCKSCTGGKDRLGGVGGGGGSGGGGGLGGGGGTAGGGAFGLFFVGAAAPVVTDNVILRGDGGGGGSGGNASAGTLGGVGGHGGQAVFCSGIGGTGGNGGAGGHGSGGGGGSGGVSYGIYTSGVGTPTYCQVGSNNVISGGSGGPAGQGGASLVNPGGAGQPGAIGACSFH